MSFVGGYFAIEARLNKYIQTINKLRTQNDRLRVNDNTQKNTKFLQDKIVKLEKEKQDISERMLEMQANMIELQNKLLART